MPPWLEGNVPRMQQKIAGPRQTVKWLIALCLLLMLVSAVVQAVHSHPTLTANELKDCPFCQVATATTIAVLVVLLYAVRLQRTAFVADCEEAQAIAPFDTFNLFSRPPPTA